MKKLFKRLRNSKHGFSLVELIVVIAIMAVIAAVLVPSLLMHVEESRAEKDIKTTDEVVTAVELALADQDVYDELVEHSVFDNVSCYVDKDSESGYEKVVIKETYNGYAEQYMFDDDARQNDEVPYYGAGNMRGLTITFSPEKDSNESTYELSSGIINRFVGRKTGYLYENEKLYNAIRSVVGDKIYNSSQTYRNSDFTIFIRLGSAGGNEAGNQDATQVWGQYNGTNLPADTVQTAKITTDRNVGDAGQYDQAVNDYINDEANTNIDFSKLSQMGNSNFGENIPQKAGLYKPDGTFVSWEELTEKDKDFDNGCCVSLNAILNVDENGVLKCAVADCCVDNLSAEYLNGKLIIDSSIKGIGSYAFAKCEGLTSIELPNSITSISWCAFEGCTNLTSINIPINMEIIEDGAFRFTGLTSIVIPENITSINPYAFADCPNLKSVKLSNNLINIGEYAFSETNITSIQIPSKVTSIGVKAFDSGKSLISITVDKNNPIYDSRNNCNAIIETKTNTLIQGCQNTVIPNDITNIGKLAFSGCENLKSITIPNGIKTIGSQAFWCCTNLASMTIPSTVTNIEDSAFAHCSSLTNIVIPSSVTTIGSYAFSYCENLINITLPNTITSIAPGMLMNCSSIEYMVLPNSIKTIDERAFENCTNLKDITIPDGTETINGNAFNKCIGLNTIYIPSSVKTINIKGNWYSGAPFTKCSPNLKIYCGAKSKQSGWHQYWNCDGSNTSSNKVSVTYNITRAVYLSKYKK